MATIRSRIVARIKNVLARKAAAVEALADQTQLIGNRWMAFQKRFLETGNFYQSAIDAGFAPSTAKTIKYHMPEIVKKNLVEAMEQQGITSDKIAEKIGVLLDNPDYKAIDRGLAHAMRARGDYQDEKELSGLQRHVVLHIPFKALPYEQKIKYLQTGIIDDVEQQQIERDSQEVLPEPGQSV